MLSDRYPPASLGGYEVAAAEVAEALRQRGHDVRVLVTDAPAAGSAAAGAAVPQPHVERTLRSRSGVPVSWSRLAEEARRQRDDRAALDRALDVGPDVVFLWNVGGVSHHALARLMNGPVPTVIYVFGDWPLRKFLAPQDLDPWTAIFAPRPEPAWRAAARAALRGAARLRGVATRAPALRFDHLEYGSRFMLEALERGGFRAGGSQRLVYYGLFGEYARAAAEPPPRAPDGRALLFVGRLWEAKGVHTLVEAFGILAARGEGAATLTIAGPEEHADYAAGLRQRAEALGVAGRVRWLGPVPRAALLGLYRSHDVLVFPSVYDEPFGIVQLEAMAAGCAVVGTGTGGSAEILEDGANALVFRAGDAAHLAEQLSRVLGDPALRDRLRDGGRRTVRARFLGERMVDAIEAHLVEIVRGARR